MLARHLAQTVVAMHLEQRAEPRFHPDSYGYRPGRSAHDALETCRKRCWRYDWAIDMDVQKFFDTVPWDLVVKAVETVTDTPWVLLYVKRWLAAPLQLADGTLIERDKGTPQGSAVSPILANLFMHYAFDTWMARNHPDCPFERYADDVVVHCSTHQQAQMVLAGIAERMEQVGLRLHPDKPGSSTAKTTTGGASTSTPASPFWDTPSDPGRRGARTEAISLRSCPPSVPRRSRPKAPGFANCGSTGAAT